MLKDISSEPGLRNEVYSFMGKEQSPKIIDI